MAFQIASISSCRDQIGALAFEGKLIAFGGKNGDGMKDVVEEYDPVTDKWTKLASMKEKRSRCVVAMFSTLKF